MELSSTRRNSGWRPARRSLPRPPYPFGPRTPACGLAPSGFAGVTFFGSTTAGPWCCCSRTAEPACSQPRILERRVVFVNDLSGLLGSEPVAVDELRLSEVWSGEAIFLRGVRGYGEADTPFNLRWLVELVLQERRALRDIALASITMSVLTILPPLLVMTMVNKVLQFHSVRHSFSCRR